MSLFKWIDNSFCEAKVVLVSVMDEQGCHSYLRPLMSLEAWLKMVLTSQKMTRGIINWEGEWRNDESNVDEEHRSEEDSKKRDETKLSIEMVSIVYNFKQDCLLQGQAQLDQRVVFRFSTLRLRLK